MIFFDKRKKRKTLAELKSRRRAEDDLLTPALRSRFDAIIADLAAAESGDIKSAVQKAEAAYRALPLPKRNWLFGLLDLIFVVGAIAFGLRGLFFQPFRIPTGSMQPTLYGIHYRTAENVADLPGWANNIFRGGTKAELKVDAPGEVRELVDIPGGIFDRTEVVIGNRCYTLPGNSRQVIDYPGWGERNFKGGEIIGGGILTIGDHLFVERFSLYLKEPQRGDVMVFNTENLVVECVPLLLTGGYYYIKRVAALPGDTVKIIGHQLYVRPQGAEKFAKIQDIAPAFRKVYSGRGGYHGHLSGMGFARFAYGEEFTVPENTYLMLGDNSAFSMDSRYFGVVPRRNLIGRAWVVFYPFSRRMGLVDRQEPLDKPTGKAGIASFPVMWEQ